MLSPLKTSSAQPPPPPVIVKRRRKSGKGQGESSREASAGMSILLNDAGLIVLNQLTVHLIYLRVK